MNRYKVNTYEKIPKKVQAIQWNGKNFTQIEQFASPYNVFLENGYGPDILKVKTLSGWTCCDYNDYVIKGTTGEIYPCKKHIFDELYKEA